QAGWYGGARRHGPGEAGDAAPCLHAVARRLPGRGVRRAVGSPWAAARVAHRLAAAAAAALHRPLRAARGVTARIVTGGAVQLREPVPPGAPRRAAHPPP